MANYWDNYKTGALEGGVNNTKNWGFDSLQGSAMNYSKPVLDFGAMAKTWAPLYANNLSQLFGMNTANGRQSMIDRYRTAATQNAGAGGFHLGQNLQRMGLGPAFQAAAAEQARQQGLARANNMESQWMSPEGQAQQAQALQAILSGLVNSPYHQAIQNAMQAQYQKRGGLTLGSAIGAGLSLAGGGGIPGLNFGGGGGFGLGSASGGGLGSIANGVMGGF